MSFSHLVSGPHGTRWKRRGLWLAVFLLASLLVTGVATPTFAQTPASSPAPAPRPDPAGTGVGSPEDLAGITVGGASVSADDIAKAKTSEPFAYNLAGYVNQNRLAINLVWTLVAGFLVMFM